VKRGQTIGLAAVATAVLLLAGSMIVGMVGDAGAPGPVDAPARTVARRVRVEVLNASGVSGLARTATERLRDGGYDVVYFGNARGFGPDTSMVLNRAGEPENAHGVARLLDIARVVTRPDSTLYLEVTVVIGRDWTGIPADTVAGR